MAYLIHYYEPSSSTDLNIMQQRAKAYKNIGDDLFKTLVIGPPFRCLSKDR
jgi:hypothetical protein